jgi:hypothetical protein
MTTTIIPAALVMASMTFDKQGLTRGTNGIRQAMFTYDDQTLQDFSIIVMAVVLTLSSLDLMSHVYVNVLYAQV